MFTTPVITALKLIKPTPYFPILLGKISSPRFKNYSTSSRYCSDEVKSRRSRSFEAFQELASTTPRAVRDDSYHSITEKPSSPVSRIQIKNATDSPRKISRNIEAVRQDNDTNDSQNDSQLGRKTNVMSAANKTARRIAAKWSSRVRNQESTGNNRGRQRRRGGGIRGAPRKPRKKPWEEEAEPPYTDEEIEYLDSRDGGFTTPYNPDTGLHNLARHRPAIISDAAGLVDSVRYRLAVTTDNVSPQYRISSQHLMRIERGKGTLFEDPDQRSIIQAWKDKLDQERANIKDVPYIRQEFSTLPQKTRNKIMGLWIAGHYEAPVEASLENPFNYVRNYAKRNETWLPEDAKKFEETLASILPSEMLPP